MEYNILPNSNIKVSKICLGTMTWGRQNNQQEAFDQMDYSIDKGAVSYTHLTLPTILLV